MRCGEEEEEEEEEEEGRFCVLFNLSENSYFCRFVNYTECNDYYLQYQVQNQIFIILKAYVSSNILANRNILAHFLT